jgi:hypothetical protein
MRPYLAKRVLLAMILAALSLGGLAAGRATAPSDVGVPGSPVPESADFASLEMRDPWDMQEYSDVSQYMNEGGQQSLVTNPEVANGLFTGQSVGHIGNGNTTRFFPLFPGYANNTVFGKIGQRYPIDASTYHCLYIAMKVDSNAANGFGVDKFLVFWFQDNRLNGGGAEWGGAPGITLYPEAGNGAPAQGYRLYKVDLAAINHSAGNTDWDERATWEALRIDPTINAGIDFAVDWIRLTSCAANNQNFTWTDNSSVTSLWLKRTGTTRFIRVATGLDGDSGAGSVDLQGVPPGTYTAGVGTATTCCIEESDSTLLVNQTPIVDFVSPSFHSGDDYASQAGVPWNFDSSDDVYQVANMQHSIAGGLLDMTTASGPMPAGVDAQFFLRTPQPITASHYRYLSFRLLTEWNNPWQNTPHGMIARLVWLVQGENGPPNSRCYFVSQDIPLDVGWHTYWIDLGDTFNGTPDEKAGDCPGGLPTWSASAPILDLRFDPNENVTVAAGSLGGGGPFHQQMDWMRLAAIDQVDQGKPYLVRLSINRSVSALTYYYTTNLANPTQAAAQAFVPPAPNDRYAIYLPFVSRPGEADLAGLPQATHSFLWDTSGVAPNTYFLCASAAGGGNTATFCSETPVIVQ